MKIRELLNSPDKWCKNALALDKNGNMCCNGEAVSWCIYGAALKCYRNGKERWTAVDKIKKILGITDNGSLVDWNNNSRTTFEELTKVLRQADV